MNNEQRRFGRVLILNYSFFLVHYSFPMQLYFLALLPDPAIQQEVTAFKETARDRFGSGHALKSPPHITLVPPFRLEKTPESGEALEVALRDAAPGPSFPVQLRDFDRFGQRVIFVHVQLSEALITSQRQAADAFYRHLGVKPETRPFHPHLTVAFRDLDRKVFPEAWAYFSGISYQRTFTAERVTLLRHNGQRWEIAGDSYFSGA